MTWCEPSATQGRQMRLCMEEALWGSVPPLLELPPPARPIAEVLQPGLTRPLDFGVYFDLALGPPDGSDLPEAARRGAAATLARRLGEVTGRGPEPGELAAEPRITGFSHDFYTADDLSRLSRWWDTEPDNALNLCALKPDRFSRSHDRVMAAMDHLRAAAPELHGEICALISDIVLAGQDGTQLLDFGGVSSFCLWGAIVLSDESNNSWPRVYQTIVHEAAHNLLFAFARDQPLVEGGGAERSLSPLRRSQRPMDGIYHAAFVSSREALALDLLLIRHEAAPCLSSGEVDEVRGLLDESVLAFRDCADVVRREANLTALGEAILADCEVVMGRTFAVVDG
jgi:HEXXH motif-containing protein